MKPVRLSSLAGTFTVMMLAAAFPSAAQDFAASDYYDYGRPVPPRPIPNVATETVVTTTRRIVAAPAYDGYAPPQTVVTTRKVVTTNPAAPLDIVPTGFAPPLPPRRIVKDVIVAPAFGEQVVTRRVTPAQPVVIEERRVETTRRIIGPSPDWAE
jgi:hypothetical protein